VYFINNVHLVPGFHGREDDGNWVELVLEPVLKTFAESDAVLVKKTDTVVTSTVKNPDGIVVSKTLTLDAEPPFHTLTISVSNTTKTSKDIVVPLTWTGGLHRHLVGSDPKSRDADAMRAEMRVAAFQNHTQSWRPGLIFGRTIDNTLAGPFEWAGVDNHHFIAAFLMKEGLPSLHVSADRKTPPALEVPLTFSLAPGETKSQALQLYVGPKKYSNLKKIGHNLDHSVEFGTFGIIAKILLRALQFFEQKTGNFGWAIVLLTICIQILVYPLTKRSLAHSVRMKELQPQIKQIQEQYKNDQKRIQIEMLNLYQKNGMKFMGMEGCFPMLMQIPIFFAFYATLRVAYELRGASWMWIPDLGLHDPYYVLPLLMGVGMFIQQKTTTVAADPAQAKMMMFMPVIMVFMFLKLPAGLVLYWSVNSICTIIIQKFLQWRHHAAPTAA
jgi:YidC/Oxa1 family membrane protein insertase